MPCEVIVAGAGPAGTLAAIILSRAGARVTIFERTRFPRHKLCGDTLNPGALSVLALYLPPARLEPCSLPLDGMLLTGPGGVTVRGRYGRGRVGRAITRRELDVMLLEHALAAGAQVEDETAVTAPIRDAAGRVKGVTVQSRGGRQRDRAARVVIAADGRTSRLARAAGLARHPQRPRRWAIGGYFEQVDGTTDCGEMHVRAGHYLGVAPVPSGLTNACLVVPHHRGGPGLGDPQAALLAALAADGMLARRFARARLVAPPQVLGPMAVEVGGAGVPGMLLAGDAAGFIDPITGDGLRFALLGARLGAEVALAVLGGALDEMTAAQELAARRHAAFANKWRFNRAIRRLVASPPAVWGATLTARVLPRAFEAAIRYAGDCD